MRVNNAVALQLNELRRRGHATLQIRYGAAVALQPPREALWPH